MEAVLVIGMKNRVCSPTLRENEKSIVLLQAKTSIFPVSTNKKLLLFLTTSLIYLNGSRWFKVSPYPQESNTRSRDRFCIGEKH